MNVNTRTLNKALPSFSMGRKASDVTDAPGVVNIGELQEKVAAAAMRLQRSRHRRRYTVSVGTPLFLLALVMIALNIELFINWVPISDSVLALIVQTETNQGVTNGIPVLMQIVLGWIAIGSLVVCPYLLLVEWAVQSAKVNLEELEIELRSARLSDEGERRNFLRGELARLTIETPQVLFENQKHYEHVKKSRDRASRLLESDDPTRLTEVQSLIDSIQVMALREKQQQSDQRRLQYSAGATILFYFALVFYIGIYSFTCGEKCLDIGAVGVPLLIIFWSTVGSLAATLYRFYTLRDKVDFLSESRWLIARPAIGIVMGSLAYLVYSTGLVVALRTDPSNLLNMQFAYVLAFLASFSDKFYLSLVDLLLDKTLGSKVVAEIDVEAPELATVTVGGNGQPDNA